jgi:hypothetical protein
MTRSVVRFVSYEPAVGPLGKLDLGIGTVPNWIIIGGESGPKARTMNPQWAREVRDQCKPLGVPLFLKQWGTYASIPSTTKDVSSRGCARQRDEYGHSFLLPEHGNGALRCAHRRGHGRGCRKDTACRAMIGMRTDLAEKTNITATASENGLSRESRWYRQSRCDTDAFAQEIADRRNQQQARARADKRQHGIVLT